MFFTVVILVWGVSGLLNPKYALILDYFYHRYVMGEKDWEPSKARLVLGRWGSALLTAIGVAFLLAIYNA